MKKQKVVLETMRFDQNRFRVVKVYNTLDVRPGDTLSSKDVEQMIIEPIFEVEVRARSVD